MILLKNTVILNGSLKQRFFLNQPWMHFRSEHLNLFVTITGVFTVHFYV